MRYCPAPSVTLLRTLVISAGLDASTVTPGSAPPEVSRTAPARLWADASDGIRHTLLSVIKSALTSLVVIPGLRGKDRPVRRQTEGAAVPGESRRIHIPR